MIKRAHIRFRPEVMTFAKIRLAAAPESSEILSVVRDESYRGCSLIVQRTPQIKQGSFCHVKTGELAELPARVVWVAPFQGDFVKVGFEYLE